MKRTSILSFFLLLYTAAFLQGQQQMPLLAEEVLAFTSDEYVMPGEHLWVEARVSYHGKATPSKILYLEMINREGVSVLQEMARIEDGRAMAYLPINDMLPSDYYLLRVYTKVSPYHSPEKGMHHQLIGVINPAIPPKAPLQGSIHHTQDFHDASQPFPFGGISDGEAFRTNEDITLTWEGKNSEDMTVAISYVGDLPNVPLVATSELYDTGVELPVPQPEIFGHLIHGRALRFPIDTTETYYLSAHGLASKLMISKPLTDGSLFFESAEFLHYDFVIVQAENQESQLDFVLESPFWPMKPKKSFQLPELHLPEKLLHTLQNRLLANQTSSYYFPAIPYAPDTLPPFLVADYAYLLDDYNRFDDMATVIREYVPTVLVRRENRKTIFKNVNKPATVVFQNNPLILIDAMPVFDSDAFAQFNPARIRKMEVVNRQFYLDHKDFDGVINLTSFENDFGKFDLPKNALFIAYKGIQIPKNHEGTLVKNQDKRIADLRALRAWRTLSDQTSLKVETGMLTGKFKIRYQNWKMPSPHTESKTIIIN